MSQTQEPILSYFFLSRNPRSLRAVLFIGGLLTFLMNWAVPSWWPEVLLPPEIPWVLGSLACIACLLSLLPQLRRHVVDLAFLVFVFYYLAVVFLSYLNHLPPIFVTILIATQILFAISFRNLFEFLIFAISSLALFVICTFYLPNLETQPHLFIILMAIATIFSGVYIWSRERFLLQVRHSGSMLGDLLDSSIFSIFLLEIDGGKVLYQNQIAGTFLQDFFGTKDLAATKLLQTLELDSADLHLRFPVASPEKIERKSFQRTDQNGAKRDLECYLSRIRTMKEDSILLRLRDITTEKEAESALKDSEKTYREIFNAGTAGILILDPTDFNTLDANQIALQMLGKERSELLNGDFCELAESTQQTTLQSFLEKTVAGEAKQLEISLHQNDGIQIAVEVTASLAILKGDFRLMLILTDIAERLEKRAALQASEQRYRTLVEKMNEGLVMTDQEENILFVNNRMCEIVGMSKESLIGNKTYDVLQGEEVLPTIQDKSELRQQGLSDRYELQLRKQNEDLIWVMVTGSPYVNSAGDIIGTIAIITDITARKATEFKLQDKNSQLDAFVYKASHDLKGPLASIIGVTNIARAEVDDPTAHKFFDMISKSTKRLDLILSELIDVTRINKALIKWEEVQIESFVQEMIQSLQHLPNAENVEFDVNIQFTEALITDRKLMTSILQNLIVNSIIYQNPKADPPKIHIHIRKQLDRILIEVRDNGVGIPERMRKRVFEMFYRGNTKSKGSGLGLYIVKSAVEKLNGSCEMESEEGKGSRFLLAFPLQQVEPSSLVSDAAP